jgi:hypothetical protein
MKFEARASDRITVAPVDREEALHHHIVNASQNIRNYLRIFELVRRPKMRRANAFIESHGGYFEH